ncbi:MAG TPA: ATP synthase F0 subunit C [Desulfobacterales bacterium]|nr:ATP synthase F0 subunit C [Desulfobacterales bacterium]
MNVDLHLLVTMAAYAGAGICIGIGAIGAAIGEGYAAAQATLATGRRPELSGEIFKTMLVGQAISESSSIFALVVALVLMFTAHQEVSTVSIVVPLAAGLCMGFGSLGSGIGAGYPAAAACTGIARQPAMAGRLNTNMIIGSAVCQTPATFSLVIAFILLYSDFSGRPASPTWAALLGAGLATGLAAIGPGLGGGLVAEAGCEGTARNPEQAKNATNVMLLGQAIAQTTSIYGLLVSFILIFKSYPATDLLAPAAGLLSAGICVGIGAIGPGIGVAMAARSAVAWIPRNPTITNELIRTMLIGAAVAESTGIYALVISLVLIFVV